MLWKVTQRTQLSSGTDNFTVKEFSSHACHPSSPCNPICRFDFYFVLATTPNERIPRCKHFCRQNPIHKPKVPFLSEFLFSSQQFYWQLNSCWCVAPLVSHLRSVANSFRANHPDGFLVSHWEILHLLPEDRHLAEKFETKWWDTQYMPVLSYFWSSDANKGTWQCRGGMVRWVLRRGWGSKTTTTDFRFARKRQKKTLPLMRTLRSLLFLVPQPDAPHTLLLRLFALHPAPCCKPGHASCSLVRNLERKPETKFSFSLHNRNPLPGTKECGWKWFTIEDFLPLDTSDLTWSWTNVLKGHLKIPRESKTFCLSHDLFALHVHMDASPGDDPDTAEAGHKREYLSYWLFFSTHLAVVLGTLLHLMNLQKKYQSSFGTFIVLQPLSDKTCHVFSEHLKNTTNLERGAFVAPQDLKLLWHLAVLNPAILKRKSTDLDLPTSNCTLMHLQNSKHSYPTMRSNRLFLTPTGTKRKQISSSTNNISWHLTRNPRSR